MNQHDVAVAPVITPIATTETDKHHSFIQFDQAALFELLLKLDATEFKVFTFLSLRAYGWDEKARRVGDGITRASGTFISKGTKLSLATAERCINRLKEKGLITKSTHSCKWGNTYYVKPLLLRRHSDVKSPPPPEKKKQLPQIDGASPLKKKALGPSNCGTNIDSRYSDLSLKDPALPETFENYFSNLRAPMAEKKERSCWAQIQKRNPDVSEEEFLECFKLVSKTNDAKGKAVAMRFLWLANGLDAILSEARTRIHFRKRRAEEQAQQAELATEPQDATDEAQNAKDASAQAEQAKLAIQAMFGSIRLKSLSSAHNPHPSDHERQAFLMAQARQLDASNWGRANFAILSQLLPLQPPEALPSCAPSVAREFALHFGWRICKGSCWNYSTSSKFVVPAGAAAAEP